MTDAERLAELARETVLAVMAEVDWLLPELGSTNTARHLELVKMDADEALETDYGPDKEEALRFTLTRAAMALYVYQKGKEE